jgi:hypothetical protein
MTPDEARLLAELEAMMAEEGSAALQKAVELHDQIHAATVAGGPVWEFTSADELASEIFATSAAYLAFEPRKWWGRD